MSSGRQERTAPKRHRDSRDAHVPSPARESRREPREYDRDPKRSRHEEPGPARDAPERKHTRDRERPSERERVDKDRLRERPRDGDRSRPVKDREPEKERPRVRSDRPPSRPKGRDEGRQEVRHALPEGRSEGRQLHPEGRSEGRQLHPESRQEGRHVHPDDRWQGALPTPHESPKRTAHQNGAEPRRQHERIPYPEPSHSLPGPPHGEQWREKPSPARRDGPSLRDAPPLGRNPSGREHAGDQSRDQSRGRDRDQSRSRRDESAPRQRSPIPGRDPGQWPASNSQGAGGHTSSHPGGHGSRDLHAPMQHGRDVHMLSPRGQDSREMPPPGPRPDMAFAPPEGSSYGQSRGGDFPRGVDMRGGDMQRGRGRGGRIPGPGRGGGRRMMDDGPMFDPHQGRDDTPLRGREPEFLEPMLQDEGMMGFGPDSLGGGPGRGPSMRGGLRGQGRMGYMGRGLPQGRGPGRGGRGRGPMLPLDGPPGGPSFRIGMGQRGGLMDQAGPGGRFGGRGFGPIQGPGWGPRGSFPPENGAPGGRFGPGGRMGRGGRWPMGRGRGPEPGAGVGGRGWRPMGPPAPPAGQPKLDPKVIEQRQQNTANRLRRFLAPLRISPSLAGENAMAEYNDLMQAGAEDMRSSKAAASLALRGPAVQRLFMSMAMPSEEGGIVASWADAERPDAFAECLRALRFPGQDPNVRMSKHGFYIGNPALLQAEAAS